MAITQNVQAYNVHQQALTTDLSLRANYNVAQTEVTPAVVVPTMVTHTVVTHTMVYERGLLA
jgi:hypothetical protein